jgi:methionyl-tRNA formyltransferase
MNVVFMGTPGFACPALETLANSSHHLAAVVTVPDKPSGRGRKTTACEVKLKALALEIPVLQPPKLRSPEFLAEMSALGADVYVVIAFRILPRKLYSIPPKGSINIHASLLPKYRGAAPIQHAILNGETETGLTSFFLSDKVDQGDVIDQQTISIGPDENFSSLSARLAAAAGPFLVKTLDLITQPGFTPQIQDQSQATPAPKIGPEDCLIDWHGDARRVYNQIRAFSDYPGAYSYLDGHMLKILGCARELPEGGMQPEAGELLPTKKRLYVGTGTTPLQITKIQPEGKRAMDTLSFLNGYRIEPGRKMTSVRKEVIK